MCLPNLSLRIQRTLMDATSARGHTGLKLSHAQVLPMIGTDGARPEIRHFRRAFLSVTFRGKRDVP